MKMPIRFDKDSENIVTLTFDAPGASVNTMSAEWQTAFTETVARLSSEIQGEKPSIKGVILASGKKSFFAGAELKDVIKFAPDGGDVVALAGVEIGNGATEGYNGEITLLNQTSTAFWSRSAAIFCIRASRVRTSSCSTPWARACVLLPPPRSCRPASNASGSRLRATCARA